MLPEYVSKSFSFDSSDSLFLRSLAVVIFNSKFKILFLSIFDCLELLSIIELRKLFWNLEDIFFKLLKSLISANWALSLFISLSSE